MKLYLKIQELRQQKGFTQKELADELGIPYQTISKYERGIQSPSIERAIQIASILKCSLDDLVDMEEYIREYHRDLYKLNKNIKKGDNL